MEILRTPRRALIPVSMCEDVMNDRMPMHRLSGTWPKLGCVCALACMLAGAKPLLADEPLPDPDQVHQRLTLAEAIASALENNPELAALRQQHGIAAAGVLIARTYPFNPIWEGKIRAADGPASAGITNRVSNEHKLLLEIEVRGQGSLRGQAAQAALSRTDWEIAFQETALAVRVARAFNAVLYRQAKVRLLEETIRLNEQAVEQIRALVEQARLRRADYLTARGELNDTLTQLSPGRAALAAAWRDLRLALGSEHSPSELEGKLDVPPSQWEAESLMATALERRADLHARQTAVTEADARLRLEVANRYGNPNIGPAYEYDPTRLNLIGAQISLPLPVFNTRRGEILQRQAERARAAFEVQQVELLVRHDVQAGVTRLQEARTGLELYRTQVLRDTESGAAEVELLFKNAEPGLDLPHVFDFRRKLLKARDGHLDALLEMRQALADLAAAVGDPAMALGSDPAIGKSASPLEKSAACGGIFEGKIVATVSSGGLCPKTPLGGQESGRVLCSSR
jgi:cobalt-zinc-cadmium efflux system outer membrane protein